ncbi:hypothetical protein POM88_051193 [Heracleum sosnowskyi]|uniref:Uncharacterized protein n=1 Tax=Heracleum sosnowskyi TaxID=360622 RepID=A0AAD8GZ23_9APIA|nr:hypothetical protein POM88_051193 [Heracleum sosnowskyi]
MLVRCLNVGDSAHSRTLYLFHYTLLHSSMAFRHVLAHSHKLTSKSQLISSFSLFRKPNSNPLFSPKFYSRITDLKVLESPIEYFDFSILLKFQYDSKIKALLERFPVVERSEVANIESEFAVKPSGGSDLMRRTVCHDDPVGYRRYVFIKAVNGNESGFMVLVSMVRGCLLGVKIGKSLIVFVEEKTFKVQVLPHLDNTLEISYLQSRFVLETLLGFMCYDRDSLRRAVDVVENGFSSAKTKTTPWFLQNLALVYSVIYHAVFWPGFRNFVSSRLLPGCRTYNIPHEMLDLFHVWYSVSMSYFAGEKLSWEFDVDEGSEDELGGEGAFDLGGEGGEGSEDELGGEGAFDLGGEAGCEFSGEGGSEMDGKELVEKSLTLLVAVVKAPDEHTCPSASEMKKWHDTRPRTASWKAYKLSGSPRISRAKFIRFYWKS